MVACTESVPELAMRNVMLHLGRPRGGGRPKENGGSANAKYLELPGAKEAGLHETRSLKI